MVFCAISNEILIPKSNQFVRIKPVKKKILLFSSGESVIYSENFYSHSEEKVCRKKKIYKKVKLVFLQKSLYIKQLFENYNNYNF